MRTEIETTTADLSYKYPVFYYMFLLYPICWMFLPGRDDESDQMYFEAKCKKKST
jgi:hypothetical protein